MTLRRAIRDESGVALGLAVIMVVVVGVMGAGLLTVVAADLDSILAANDGQRAFEMAEAGLVVAGARLTQDPAVGRWSSGELRPDDVDRGSVSVDVERHDDAFVATSTGTYGSATRKVEATFVMADGSPKLQLWRELYE